MSNRSDTYPIYLEIGKEKTFAGALDWPGWCRSGRDEDSALQALVATAPRYARVLQKAGLDFDAPVDGAGLVVVERLDGTATTDFGVPDVSPSVDARPVGEDDLARFEQILSACWQAFDEAVQQAAGKELRKGPRGGGREVEAIRGHVLGAEEGYLSRLGWKLDKSKARNLDKEQIVTRQAVLDALARAVREGVPPGPRGGARWTPRYFVRRVAWHVLDHAWEIEDRVIA